MVQQFAISRNIFDGFDYEPENKEITAYFHRLDIPEYTTTVSEGKRNIDALAEVYISVYEAQKMKQQTREITTNRRKCRDLQELTYEMSA